MKILIILVVVLVIILSLIIILSYRKENYADFSLQYNITNHPVRNKILASFSEDSPPPPPDPKDIQAMRDKIQNWYTNNKNPKPMDKWGVASILAALDSASMTNWPIGNLLCYSPPGTENNPEAWIELLRGGNRFFTRNPTDILSVTDFVPRFDSHGHGEMIVLDAFEDRLARGCYDKTSPNYEFEKDSPIDFRKRSDTLGYGMPDGVILFTQLNSCQMCLSRIGNSGISRCYWIAPDVSGGLAHKLCDSVPAYFNMLNRQLHTVADVSQELIQFAFDVFSGPQGKWINYCVWKLNQLGSPENLKADYGYCKGQYYANKEVGQNSMYDPTGFFRTVDDTGGPTLNCTVTPPASN
jgi:tRNA(Arg) A34 adenosine deaminase TadA